MASLSPPSTLELERHIVRRTGGRLQQLTIELLPESVILRGWAATFHVKQLAQHAVWELLPDIWLDNAIVVGDR
jgi:hypothetical protein